MKNVPYLWQGNCHIENMIRMKKVFFLVLLCLLTANIKAQEPVFLKTNEGKVLPISSLLNNGKAKVFLFWSSYCRICKIEMKGIRNVGKDWWEDYQAEVYFVSLENFPSKAYQKLDFLTEFMQQDAVYQLHDVNTAFYQSISTGTLPTTLLFDKNGNLVQRWVSYDSGLESSIGMYFKKLHNQETTSTSQK